MVLGFPHFLQFKSEFVKKEFMISGTVSSSSFFADCKLLQAYNQHDFDVDHLVMFMCKIFSCVVGRGCLLWQVCSFGKTLLAFACFIPSKVKFACYSRCFLIYYFCIPVPYNEKNIFCGVLVLKGLLGLHRTVQLQLLQHYWLVHRLGLLWYWMVCIGNEQRSFCCFWDCTQVLYSGLLLTMRATPFF